MIKPTIGRIVHFRPGANQLQPLAAIVTFVHSDSLVNLNVFGESGAIPVNSIPLVQEGHEAPAGAYCEWMPYQKGQAAKTVVGNGDMFQLLCKASSQVEGWTKSTKACELPNGIGCLVQVTTQQRNINGTYSVAEALTYVPGVKIASDENNGKKLVLYNTVSP